MIMLQVSYYTVEQEKEGEHLPRLHGLCHGENLQVAIRKLPSSCSNKVKGG